jgi:hypothetical protein
MDLERPRQVFENSEKERKVKEKALFIPGAFFNSLFTWGHCESNNTKWLGIFEHVVYSRVTVNIS